MRPTVLRVVCLQHVETVGVGQSWRPKVTGGGCRSSGGGAQGMGGEKKRRRGKGKGKKEGTTKLGVMSGGGKGHGCQMSVVKSDATSCWGA